MENYLIKISNKTFSLHRYSKRLIAIFTDLILCVLCTWIAFLVRAEYWLSIRPQTNQLILFQDFNIYSISTSLIIAIPIFWLFGLYRTIFRYTGFSIFFSILMSSTVYGFMYYAIGVYLLDFIPRPIGFFQPVLLFFMILSSRLAVKYLLGSEISLKNSFIKKKNKVLVYGAGDAGRQLVTALENSP